MATNIPVQDLDFDNIKDNLKSFLQNQTQFQDYDFEGSSMSILLDVLAYTTHYSGFHAHMLNNESNIDSAMLKSSMTSKAKFQNYIPGSKKSSEAVVTMTAQISALNEPLDRKIIIPRGQTIKSNNNISDSRTFVVTDDIHIYNSSLVSGIYDYSSDEVQVYEGTFEEQRYLVDTTLINQRYIIRDPNIDITSLRVRVFDSENDSNFVTYKRASDHMVIDGTSAVYFVTVNEDDYYEIQFGNDVYGRAAEHGNMVECTFVSSNGELGNNAKLFTFGGDYNYNGTDYTIDVATVAPAEGGMEPEGVEDLRFNIPYHYRRQNRAVVIDDYKNLLMAEYRNINSINVWGGEDNEPKAYGKVFICIKPKFGEVLSSKAKENITNKIIKRHNVVVIESEIVDPDYLYVNMMVNINYNPLNTVSSSGQVVTGANNAIKDYDTNVLNRFGGFYSDLELNSRVRASDPSILTSYTSLTLEKRFTPTLDVSQTYYIDFVNPLVVGSVKSDEFIFRLSRCYFKEDKNANIRIWFYNTGAAEFQMYPDEVFGEVDHDKGIVRLSGFEVNGLYENELQLPVFATPVKPDFFTKRNNIVVINETQIKAIENFENENEKV